jgi:Flp pilus assembly protein TadG
MQLDRTSKRRREAGTTFVIVTMFVVALIGFAALSLDVGNVLREQRKANTGTDAGALAAVLLLTNTMQNVGSVTTEAQVISGANGVTLAEINASTEGNIEVGIWANNQFLANTTTNARYNAVLVPARRAVPLLFGKVIGLDTMNPAVRSVAYLDFVSSPECSNPFGVTSNILGTAAIGSTITVSEKQGESGQWGQLNFNGETGQPQDWQNAMLNGYCGGGVSVGSSDAITDTGSDHVKQIMNAIADSGQILIVPVVDTLDFTGKTSVNIIGFVGLQVTDVKGGGATMVITLKVVSAVTTGAGGGPPGPVFVQTRTLVQ